MYFKVKFLIHIQFLASNPKEYLGLIALCLSSSPLLHVDERTMDLSISLRETNGEGPPVSEIGDP